MVFVNALFPANRGFIILANMLGIANTLFCAKYSQRMKILADQAPLLLFALLDSTFSRCEQTL